MARDCLLNYVVSSWWNRPCPFAFPVCISYFTIAAIRELSRLYQGLYQHISTGIVYLPMANQTEPETKPKPKLNLNLKTKSEQFTFLFWLLGK